MRDHPSDQFDRRDGILINSFPDQIKCLFKGSMIDKTRCDNGKCSGVTAVKLDFLKITFRFHAWASLKEIPQQFAINAKRNRSLGKSHC